MVVFALEQPRTPREVVVQGRAAEHVLPGRDSVDADLQQKQERDDFQVCLVSRAYPLEVRQRRVVAVLLESVGVAPESHQPVRQLLRTAYLVVAGAGQEVHAPLLNLGVIDRCHVEAARDGSHEGILPLLISGYFGYFLQVHAVLLQDVVQQSLEVLVVRSHAIFCISRVR